MSDKVEAAVDRYGYGKNRPGNASVAYVAETQLRDIRKTLSLRVLSENDWKHWITRGYVVVKQIVPAENVKRLVDLLWEFQEMDPADSSTWYKGQLRDHAMKELNNSGMVEIYNHQYLWDNRQYGRLYDAFVDIWDNEKLWVTIDRANLNPPNRSQRPFSGFIHWDADTTLDPLPVNVQGVLSLVDQKGATRQPRSLETGHHRLRDPTRHAQGGRSADIQQPARPRHPPQYFERQSSHGPVRLHDPGRRIPRRPARAPRPLMERNGAAARICLSRRPAGVGKEKLFARQADSAGREIAGCQEVERLAGFPSSGNIRNRKSRPTLKVAPRVPWAKSIGMTALPGHRPVT